MKKILILFLCLSIVLPSVVGNAVEQSKGVMAQPTGYKLVDTGFKNEAEIAGWETKGSSQIKWVEDGANGKDGALQVVKTPNSSRFFGTSTFVQLIPGETYDIEFDARTVSGTMALQIYGYYLQGDAQLFGTTSNFSEGWTHFKVTFTPSACLSADKSEKRTNDGRCDFYFRPRFMPDDSYFIDNVKITSRGTVIQEDVDKFFIYDDPVPAPISVNEKHFADIQEHWAKTTVEMMASAKNISGVSENTFEPDRKITRAEYLQLLINTLKMDDVPYKDVFDDVSSGDWYASSLQLAFELGLIDNNMIHDDCFYPETAITRQEAASVTAGLLELKQYVSDSATMTFSDEAEISNWVTESIEYVVSLSVMHGFEDGTFRPHDSLTRAEAAQILLNIEELKGRWAFYVDPINGDDTNNGKMAKPFKTVQAASNEVKKHNADMKHNIYIYLKGGEHQILSTVKLNQSHSGTNGYDVIFTSYGDDTASMIGGHHISCWETHDEEKNIYKASIPANIYSRHLYINGLRATRARTEAGLKEASKTATGVSTTDTFWADLSKPTELEAVYMNKWTSYRFMADKIEERDGLIYIDYNQKWWLGIRDETHSVGPTIPYYVENAYELLDSPGEFYINSDENCVYYIPRIFEDMNTVDAVIPATQTLISIEGVVDEKTDDSAHNIVFDKIEFKYTTDYTIRDLRAMVNTQNNYMYADDPTGENGKFTSNEKYKRKLMPSSVYCNNVKYVDFYDCDFAHIGNVALKMLGAVQNCNIERNNIYDVSANCISVGDVNCGADFKGDNLLQLDGRYQIKNVSIKNNYMHTGAVEYYPALALSMSWGTDCEILHNEIFDNTAGGMHFGWGWGSIKHSPMSNLKVSYNYIHDILNKNLYDSGSIYNVGPWGKAYTAQNEISYNYMTEQYNRCGVMYSDQGSTNIHWKKNVIDLSMIDRWYAERGSGTRQNPSMLNGDMGSKVTNITFEDIYTTTDYHLASTEIPSDAQAAAKLYPDANWPQEALSIIENSGIEPAYTERFPEVAQDLIVTADKYIRSAEFHNQPINSVMTKGDNEVKTGDEFMLNVQVKGRKNTILENSDIPIFFYSHNPEIVTVDERGKVTAVGKGVGVIDVYGLMEDEILKTIKVEVYVDDGLIFTEELEVHESGIVSLPKSASMEYGRLIDITELSYEIVSGEENISISEDYKLIGKKKGEAVLKATIKTPGTTLVREINVIITDPLPEGTDGTFGTDVKYADMNSMLSDTSDWAISGNGGVELLEKLDNGLGTFGGYSVYTGKAFLNEVFEFDMRHNWGEGGGWRCIMLRDQSKDPNDGYKKGGYMINFDAEDCSTVSLQRFNDGGTRTIFYGNMDGMDSLAGDYLPSGMVEGEPARVKVAAINVENGVRLVMTVNGETIFDIVDTATDRIEKEGYFMFYESKGRLDILKPTK